MVTKARFICYHIPDSGETDKTVPIATGRSLDEARSIGITRTLASCVLSGGLQTQDRTADVTEATFTSLTEFLNRHFMAVDREVRGD